MLSCVWRQNRFYESGVIWPISNFSDSPAAEGSVFRYYGNSDSRGRYGGRTKTTTRVRDFCPHEIGSRDISTGGSTSLLGDNIANQGSRKPLPGDWTIFLRRNICWGSTCTGGAGREKTGTFLPIGMWFFIPLGRIKKGIRISHFGVL